MEEINSDDILMKMLTVHENGDNNYDDDVGLVYDDDIYDKMMTV